MLSNFSFEKENKKKNYFLLLNISQNPRKLLITNGLIIDKDKSTRVILSMVKYVDFWYGSRTVTVLFCRTSQLNKVSALQLKSATEDSVQLYHVSDHDSLVSWIQISVCDCHRESHTQSIQILRATFLQY
jgi:hypothetical protein